MLAIVYEAPQVRFVVVSHHSTSYFIHDAIVESNTDTGRQFYAGIDNAIHGSKWRSLVPVILRKRTDNSHTELQSHELAITGIDRERADGPGLDFVKSSRDAL